MIRPRYLFPVLPFFIIVSTHPIRSGIKWVRSNINKLFVIRLFSIILSLSIIIILYSAFHRILNYRKEVLNREETNLAVKAGQWLEINFPYSSRILTDHFNYIPPSFQDVTFTWGGTLEMLEMVNPDIILINRRVYYAYEDITAAEDYIRGDEDYFLERYHYYDTLRNEQYNFQLVYDLGDVKIYSRNTEADHIN
jgi:hypothetical protein